LGDKTACRKKDASIGTLEVTDFIQFATLLKVLNSKADTWAGRVAHVYNPTHPRGGGRRIEV
jgi:hypothetical protein